MAPSRKKDEKGPDLSRPVPAYEAPFLDWTFAEILKGHRPSPKTNSSFPLSRHRTKADADLSSNREFPSLSNNPQMSNASQASMWSGAGTRSLNGPIQRNSQTPVSSQQGQEDIFHPPPSRLQSSQGSFRFGNTGSTPNQSQTPIGPVDDFPPLNRNANGEIGSERGTNLLSSMGFAAPAPAPAPAPNATMQSNRGNGLLNALSANTRASESRTTPGASGSGEQARLREGWTTDIGTAPREGTSGIIDSPPLTLASFKDDAKQTSLDAPLQPSKGADLVGMMDEGISKGKGRVDDTESSPEVIDPLAGMAEVDKWGIKGLRTMMNNYPDYRAMIVGIDPNTFGLDMSSPECVSLADLESHADSAQPPVDAKLLIV